MYERIMFLELLLVCHVLGDFVLQTDRIEADKESVVGAYFKHILLYALPFLGCYLLSYIGFRTAELMFSILSCVFVHALIDLTKIKVAGRIEERHGEDDSGRRETWLFAVDQGLHLATLISVVVLSQPGPMDMPKIAERTVPFVLYLLCLAKPANIVFPKLFPGLHEEEENTSGKLIGTLERLMVGLLILLSQYTAIGLAMIAQSVARYARTDRNPGAVEYYIMETLYNVLCPLALYFIVFRIPAFIAA